MTGLSEQPLHLRNMISYTRITRLGFPIRHSAPFSILLRERRILNPELSAGCPRISSAWFRPH